MLTTNKVYQGDCLDLLPQIDDKSINLIIIDPPYNIGKDTWDKIDNYLEFMQQVFLQCERILKDNGSFYWFHNDFETICELRQILKQTRFVFKQLIIWNKRFENCKNKGFLDGFIETNQLRNYQQMVEYLLFYTFQDETGSNLAAQKVVQSYLKQELNKYGIANDINKLFWKNKWANFGSNIASHFFGDNNQNCLPTKQNYERLQSTGYFQKPYESLRQEYESLRQEYESLRYTFNNQKTHHSVWNYEIPPKCGHITPKPVELIENIIKHSSNENDLILDCFGGSGTTGLVAKNLNRNFILIEKESQYVDLIEKRLNAPQLKLT